MTRDALYCFENESANAVAQKMADWWVWRLPVVNRDKRLIGMVSLARDWRRAPRWWDRQFESCFLQARVGCELGPTSRMSPIRHADHNRVPFQAAGLRRRVALECCRAWFIWRPHGAPVVRVDVGD